MPLERVSKSFKDISMSFQRSPLNGDLIAIKNANAIARSIRNIVLTLRGERFFAPQFGSSASRMLFDTIDSYTASLLQDEISNSIISNEPRVILNSVNVYPDYDNGEMNVVINYRIVGIDVQPQKLSFALQPTR